MEKIKELKNQKWVIGVSGGCDSMALLHMCIKANVDIVIAHVNYKKRETANRDMEGVLSFASKHQIPCFVMEVNEYKEKENFQMQAREIRYRFYEKCKNENSCEGVLVAHHKDDVVETYLMQKKANRMVEYFGIREEVVLYNIRVKRLLLNYSKKQLREYCESNHIPYYEDESNFTDAYERNRIRHHMVEKMSEHEKDILLLEMNEKNERILKRVKEAESLLAKYPNKIEVNLFLQMNKEIQPIWLRLFILKNSSLVSVSKKAIENMILWITSHKKSNQRHTINDVYDLVVEYGYLYVDTKEEVNAYAYTLEKIEYMNTPYFSICESGKTIEKVSVDKEDFPLLIRPAKKGDEIKLRMGTKKVRRFFIDNKIPHKQREIWPVVENKDGIVIFVSGIGCDINHYSNNYSFFVLK